VTAINALLPRITRDQVLAYRVAAQELVRPAAAQPPAVLGIGVQDSPPGSALAALAARRSLSWLDGPDGLDGDALTLAWSVRGAPHLHRAGALSALAAATWPRDDADAVARLGTAGRAIKRAGISGLDAFRLTSEALHAVVTGPLSKGEASAAVTARVPGALAFDCKPCGSRHIYGSLFQQAALAGGVRLERSGRGTTLAPAGGWPGVPAAARPTPLIEAYLTLLGPACREAVAAFLGTKPAILAGTWPPGLAEVNVDGERAWLPEGQLDALHATPGTDVVRLLPPGDPFLQARDRELVVPEEASRRALWRPIGSPGALLIAGEIQGTWQSRTAGRALDIAVTGFRPLPPPTRKAVEAEAERLAAARGAPMARVRFDAA